MCLYPTLIKNRKYMKNKKNGGKVPQLTDRRCEYVPVGCGNCIECRKQKARQWQVRLLEDIKTNTNGKFITLTFSNESIKKICEEGEIKKTNKETGKINRIRIQDLQGYEKDNAIASRGIRLFTERWRKEYKKTIRHWLVTELGHNGTENIHIHGIIWTNEPINKIRELWQYGYIWPRKETEIPNYVNNNTINYLIKYLTKIDQRNKEYKSKVLTSKGIGENFLNTIKINEYQNEYISTQAKNIETKELEYYITSTGHKINLPIYWRNKLFNEETKERLWINRLDTFKRYVCGEEVNIINGTENYDKLVNYYRIQNAKLGYGNKPNENRKEYENCRREILIQTRIKKASGGV